MGVVASGASEPTVLENSASSAVSSASKTAPSGAALALALALDRLDIDCARACTQFTAFIHGVRAGEEMAEVAPQFALRALLLAAIVPIALATEYVQYTSGASCEDPTYPPTGATRAAHSITTLEECSAAAVALGLSDTTAQEDGNTGSWIHDPAYCYMSGGSLQFNSAGTNTGSCEFDPCVCVTDFITISVSGGNYAAPYYTFDGGAPPTLEVGQTYTFVDGGVSGSHPFRITGEDGGLPITITLDEANSAPEYYCETHASMKATFMIFKAFTVDEFLSSKVKDLKKECNTAVEDGGRGGKWLGSMKEGNCYEKTWCEQFSKDKKGCKKAKVGAKKVCKYKKAKVAKNEKKARDAKCVIKKKSKAP